MLKQGADINYYDCYTPLEGAMSRGHRDVACILIAHGADVNIKFSDGTALTNATSMHDTELVKLLLVHGANLRIRDYSGKSALDIAKANHDVAIIALLKEAAIRARS